MDGLVITATKTGCFSVVQFLLAHKASAGKVSKEGNTALEIACRKGCWDIVNLLLAYNRVQIMIRGDALSVAVKARNVNIVKLLLGRLASPNLPDRNGKTPLLLALSKGTPQLVKILKAAANDMATAATNVTNI
jgi:ankyrin repeat protein